MKYTPALCVALLMFFVCACTKPVRTPEQQAFADELLNRPVTCKGKADCDTKWERATQWVVEHSKRGIRKATRTTIITNSERDVNSGLSYAEFEVVKYKVDDHYLIHFRSNCDQFACNPTGQMLRVDFNNFILGLPPGVAQVGPYEFHKEVRQ